MVELKGKDKERDDMQMDAIFVYARTSSTRLPAKALRQIGGKKLIEYVVDGLRSLSDKYPTVLLTSSEKSDDRLQEIADENRIFCYRGDLNDVAQRTISAIRKFEVKSFCRVNGDCPIQKEELIYEGFTRMKSGQYDLVTNIYPRSFPYGISVEIIKSETLIQNYGYFNIFEKENITSYFYRNSNRFQISSIVADTDFFKLGYEFTIDDEVGYHRMKQLIEENPDIRKKTISEIINLYRKIK